MQQAPGRLIPRWHHSQVCLSSLSSQVRVLCCSWKVLVVFLQRQGLSLPGSAVSQCHSTADDSPRAKKVTFLSWILYW